MTEWWRLLVLIMATAITINVAWMLTRPALPFLAGLICLTAFVHWLRWYRGRW